MKFIKDLFTKKFESKIYFTNEVLEKAGIKDILIVPDMYLDYEARPMLFVSFKQFDRITKLSLEKK